MNSYCGVKVAIVYTHVVSRNCTLTDTIRYYLGGSILLSQYYDRRLEIIIDRGLTGLRDRCGVGEHTYGVAVRL